MTPVTAGEVAQQLRMLGVRAGDVLYVRARLSAIGEMKTPMAGTILDGLLEAVGGSEGLLIAPAFTPVSWRWSGNKVSFHAKTRSNSGALASILLAATGSCRSAHPSHSFVALGGRAADFLADHDHRASAFAPMRKVIDANGKMLLIGCNRESPGFSTVHYVQDELGLSRRHYGKYLYCVALGDGRIWRPQEDPGCSRGFDKLYRHYMRDDNFHTAFVGNAFSILVDASRAYRTEREIIGKDPLAVICDDPACISCRILRGYNLGAAPMAIARRLAGWFAGKLRRQPTGQEGK